MHLKMPSHPWPQPADRLTRCCICWPSRAKPGVDLQIDDFQTVSERTPLLADLKPSGRFVAADMHNAGGVRLLARRLLEREASFTRTAQTVSGRSLKERARALSKLPGRK